MSFTVTVRGTHKKTGVNNSLYVTGYAITGTDGRDRDIYFGRGFSGNRPVVERGGQITVELEQGKWITQLANGATPPTPDVKGVADALPGATPLAYDHQPSAVPAPAAQPPGLSPTDLLKIARIFIRISYPTISPEDEASMLQSAAKVIEEGAK